MDAEADQLPVHHDDAVMAACLRTRVLIALGFVRGGHPADHALVLLDPLPVGASVRSPLIQERSHLLRLHGQRLAPAFSEFHFHSLPNTDLSYL